MDQIKAGDVVRLKSGGPKMTVSEVKSFKGVTKASCRWFVGDKSEQGTFPVTSLEIVNEVASRAAGK